MFNKLVPVVALALLAGPVVAADAPATAPAAEQPAAPAKSHHKKHAKKNQPPRQSLIQYPADHCGHQPRLRGGCLVAADPLYPLDFNAIRRGIEKIFSVGDFRRSDGVHEHIGFAFMRK